MTLLAFLFTVALLLWLSGFFSGSETALYSLNRVRLRYRLEQGDARARLVHRRLHPIGPTIITILIGNNIVAEMLARTTEREIVRLGLGSWSVPLATLLLTPLVLIFAEFLPKQLARRHADVLVYQVAGILGILRWLLVVPVALASLAARAIQFLVPGDGEDPWEPHTSRPNLRTFLKSQGEGPALRPIQQQLIDRVLALESITLAYEGVSRPLSDIAVLEAGATAGEARQGLGPKYFQRYLLASGGQPLGWISAATLVIAEDHQRLADLADDLPRLAADMPLHAALSRMHDMGADLALVTGAPGGDRIAFRSDCLRVLLQLKD